MSFQPQYGPGVDSACNRNEYQEYSGWGGKGRSARKADNFTAISEPQHLELYGLPLLVAGIALLYFTCTSVVAYRALLGSYIYTDNKTTFAARQQI
jgi:hypothetical protein